VRLGGWPFIVDAMKDVTRILSAIEQGDPKAAAELLPLVYGELRRLATQRIAREKPGQTLQATALVHEAYLRLVPAPNREFPETGMRWETRGHFFAAAADAMRRILVEKARRKRRLRHAGNLQREPLEGNEPAISAAVDPVDLLALDEALDRLEAASPRRAKLVKLRFFAGLTMPEVAQMLGISQSTAEADWTYAKAWLKRDMEKS
jgi:RNA polymerase sigma factor (TIGR02999 family)